EIVATNFRMLGGRPEGAAMGAGAGGGGATSTRGGDDFEAPAPPDDAGGHPAAPEISDEDIPF
ncbi:MAG TPA: hypothetical protein VN920_03565, partial [Pyrinomonadaceae bacterium]|nr:hypothetical protein [Pyrinomonadaceae bacterium]